MLIYEFRRSDTHIPNIERQLCPHVIEARLLPRNRHHKLQLRLATSASTIVQHKQHGTTSFCSHKLDNMTELGATQFELKKGSLETTGIFKKGNADARDLNPLIVLIHGTGTNATYFDNAFHS
jgi:hypothetical protein